MMAPHLDDAYNLARLVIAKMTTMRRIPYRTPASALGEPSAVSAEKTAGPGSHHCPKCLLYATAAGTKTRVASRIHEDEHGIVVGTPMAIETIDRGPTTEGSRS